MKTITEKEIKDAVNHYKCPDHYFCTVATTCLNSRDRFETCMDCWKGYCQKNNIEIQS